MNWSGSTSRRHEAQLPARRFLHAQGRVASRDRSRGSARPARSESRPPQGSGPATDLVKNFSKADSAEGRPENKRLGLCTPQGVGELGTAETRIYREHDRAKLRAREQRDDPQRNIWQPNRDAISPADPQFAQRLRHRSAQSQKLGEAEPALAGNEGRMMRLVAGSSFKQARQGRAICRVTHRSDSPCRGTNSRRGIARDLGIGNDLRSIVLFPRWPAQTPPPVAGSNSSATHKFCGTAQKQKPHPNRAGLLFLWVPDDVLLSRGQSALSSAQKRFTVLFGMGRRGSTSLWSSDIA